MNPTFGLSTLIGVAWTALTLAAQTPAPPPEVCAPAGAAQLAAGPIGAIHAHLNGFHFYSGDLHRAVRVEHYCSHLNADVLQCVIYDSEEKNARLIGVEYIITEALFNTLPAEEKKLWHSHRYEVMSGLLTAPGVSDLAEKELMTSFVSTYGKTWTLWQVDRGDKLPLGLPKLMMAFTADGQLDRQEVVRRDRDLKFDSAGLKAARAGLATRPVAPGADGWQQGPAFQIDDAWLKLAPSGVQK